MDGERLINCFSVPESDFLHPSFEALTVGVCMTSLHVVCACSCCCEKGSKSSFPTCLSMITVRFQILSSQIFNNLYSYNGGYLTHDRQTVCSSERCLVAPLTVKPIRVIAKAPILGSSSHLCISLLCPWRSEIVHVKDAQVSKVTTSYSVGVLFLCATQQCECVCPVCSCCIRAAVAN